MGNLIELLAEEEHKRWMQRTKTLLAREPLLPETRKRWKACMIPYAELSEEMKEYDREFARKIIGLIQ